MAAAIKTHVQTLRTIERSWYFAGTKAQLDDGIDMTVEGRAIRVERTTVGNVVAFDASGSNLPVDHESGLIFVWFSPRGAPAKFRIPTHESAGWTAMTFDHLDVETRPRTVMQDLADVLHFETVHHYANVQVLQPLRCSGPSMHTVIGFRWDTGIPGFTLPARFESEVWGVGFQRTEVRFLGGRVQSRHLVLPVPIDQYTTRVHLGMSVRIREGLLPPGTRPLAQALMHRFVRASFQRDVGRDAQLWQGLAPANHHLDAMDASLRAYRSWSLQFTTHESSSCPS